MKNNKIISLLLALFFIFLTAVPCYATSIIETTKQVPVDETIIKNEETEPSEEDEALAFINELVGNEEPENTISPATNSVETTIKTEPSTTLGPHDVTILIEKLNLSNTVSFTLESVDTGKEYQVVLNKDNNFTQSLVLDNGDYSIKNVVNDTKDRYTLSFRSDSFSVVDYTTSIVLEPVEGFASFSFTYFLKKNALMLSLLVIAVIAFIYVRRKKGQPVISRKKD